ncbi:hypothetical protein GB880_004720 [Paracoccus sp. SMMA_5_TC]|uniref:hypothetical protein n=2 Tax=unclassified Paracoccus (in: a-proteobacteria) TaxID=2688777 RepID=UPI0021E11142|nr:hypothetical protein [Paracoccus sp. SMMA_5_TC]UXU81702.1 hypothetical protein GB880_004720 [Paracoccus sp. SMMA_5_TC]
MLNSIVNSLLKPLTQPAAVNANASSAVAAAAQQPPASDSSLRPGFGFDLSPQALQQLASMSQTADNGSDTAPAVTAAQPGATADTAPAAMAVSPDAPAAPAAAAAHRPNPAIAAADRHPAPQLRDAARIDLPDESGLDLESARAWAIASLKRERLGDLVSRLQPANPPVASSGHAPAVGGPQDRTG